HADLRRPSRPKGEAPAGGSAPRTTHPELSSFSPRRLAAKDPGNVCPGRRRRPIGPLIHCAVDPCPGDPCPGDPSPTSLPAFGIGLHNFELHLHLLLFSVIPLLVAPFK